LRVAAVQLNSGSDSAANLAAADRHTRAAAREGAQLVVLPEKWTVIGTAEDLCAGAQELDGEAISWARQTARELQVEILAGSICERRPGQEKLSNTSVHVDRTGEMRAVYRKLHMFDVTLEERSYEESALEQPGEEIVLSRTVDGLELGLSICYDLRFPELFRILALRGAEVIVLPAAFTLPTTRDHWETLLRARAIENQCYLIAANQIGEHPGNHRSGGRSMIVDPWGVVLAQAPDTVGHIVAEVDLERLSDIRRGLPSLANRREDAYIWPQAVSV